MIEFLRSSFSRIFIFLLAINYQSFGKTTKKYALKLGSYFLFYTIFYVLWVEFDIYKHESLIPEWVINLTDLAITIMDGIMMSWVIKAFKRSIRYMNQKDEDSSRHSRLLLSFQIVAIPAVLAQFTKLTLLFFEKDTIWYLEAYIS